ncbi:IclR family transcriptional regulator [Synergistales bacterium]|nr:IclR family transcriptional regulator [Synergistales bacterium]
MNGKGEPKGEPVRAVERAFAVMESFSLDEPRLTLVEISEKISLPMSTTLRMLTTLVTMGALKRYDDRTYSLGDRIYLLGAIARAHYKPSLIIQPHMQRLRDEVGEAVSLYGIEGEDRVCYEHVPSLLTMRCVVRVGDRFQLWAGASGKLLLAYANEKIIERELKKLIPITSATIVDKDKFLSELSDIRARDYAISYGEREDGIISIAVPILGPTGEAIYALSLAGPSLRFTEERAIALIPEVQKICVEVANHLFGRS